MAAMHTSSVPQSSGKTTREEELMALRAVVRGVAGEVGARDLGEVLPRVRAAVTGVLTLPALDSFAANVCALVHQHVLADHSSPVHLQDACVILSEALAELRALRSLHRK